MLKLSLRNNLARCSWQCQNKRWAPLARPLTGSIRCLVTDISMSPVVEHALETKKPVVALESTIVTHGLPYPENLKLALEVERIIQLNGAVPATIGFIDGVPTVGLSDVQLELLADPSKGHEPIKVSRRDIPYVMAKGLSGGTTIAATMILAHKAGIKVFATGGLGGVHRGAETTMDISTDLDELSRTPVAVVCSGPKSILDIEKTLEYLETKGVYLSTYGPPGSNVPGFFTRDSGVKSPFTFSSPAEAADIIRAIDSMDLNNGSVFCIPAPESVALPKDEIDDIIDQACEDAQIANIKGKEITPFLLKRIWSATKGQSLATNVEFVKNNAHMAAEIAKELADIKADYYPHINESVTHASSNTHVSPKEVSKTAIIEPVQHHNSISSVVIGSLAVDLTCNLKNAKITDKSTLFSSHPGSIISSVGGVAHNIAQAASYMGLKDSVLLVSEISSTDQSLLEELKVKGILTPGIKTGDRETARYIAMHDTEGSLIAACADMTAVEELDQSHIVDMLKLSVGTAKAVAFDGNLNVPQVETIIKQLMTLDVRPIVLYEPTSVPRAAKLVSVPSLGVYPNHSIDLMTPNEYEMDSIFSSFQSGGKFDVDNWFPVIDSLGINESFRNTMQSMARKGPELSDIIKNGIAQQAFHLLPYIPNIIVKIGSKGVLSFQLVDNTDTIDTSKLKGYLCKGSNGVGVVVQHFGAFHVDSSQIRSVTGAGDTLLGSILADITLDKWNLRPGENMTATIQRAQKASSLTIQSELAVNPAIKDM